MKKHKKPLILGILGIIAFLGIFSYLKYNYIKVFQVEQEKIEIKNKNNPPGEDECPCGTANKNLCWIVPCEGQGLFEIKE